jgi:hypothetical protein
MKNEIVISKNSTKHLVFCLLGGMFISLASIFGLQFTNNVMCRPHFDSKDDARMNSGKLFTYNTHETPCSAQFKSFFGKSTTLSVAETRSSQFECASGELDAKMAFIGLKKDLKYALPIGIILGIISFLIVKYFPRIKFK